MRNIEQIIGMRVRLRREALRISQTELGRTLGLTFSQIQKYENATNRLSAGRLYVIAQHLRLPIEYFVREVDPTAPDTLDEELAALMEAFYEIENPLVREQVAKLIRSISGLEEI